MLTPISRRLDGQNNRLKPRVHTLFATYEADRGISLCREHRMSDREALEDLLKTVKPLAASGLKRPTGVGSSQSTLATTLAERWSTKQRLIERLLQETDPRAALDLFE